MAVDIESRLISKIVRDRDITTPLERGVSSDWFVDPTNRRLWDFIRKHHTKYGEVPTSTTVKENYPSVKLFNVEDTIDYLIDQIVNRRRRTGIIEAVQVATDLIAEGDHETAIHEISSKLASLEEDSNSKTADIDLADNPLSRLTEYESWAANPGSLRGIPIGYPTLDVVTGGHRGGQLVVIIAPPKVGKSTLIMDMAIKMHAKDYVPFVQSFEMSLLEQRIRHDAISARISLNRLKFGQLKSNEKQRYEEMLERMDKSPQFILSEASSGMTLSALSGKIRKYDPDVVFIDGVYLMIDEISGEANTPQALTNLTRGLKRLAQQVDKPIIISTQTLLWKMRGNRVSANAIGYSSSFFQDADTIYGLEKPEEEDDTSRILRIVAGRDHGVAEVDLMWDWENGIFSELTSV